MASSYLTRGSRTLTRGFMVSSFLIHGLFLADKRRVRAAEDGPEMRKNRQLKEVWHSGDTPREAGFQESDKGK